MVGIPDVNEYLRWVLQIIHCNGVETRAKFVKEIVLRKQDECLDEPKDQTHRPEQQPTPGPLQRGRNWPDHNRKNHPDTNQHIAPKTLNQSWQNHPCGNRWHKSAE